MGRGLRAARCAHGVRHVLEAASRGAVEPAEGSFVGGANITVRGEGFGAPGAAGLALSPFRRLVVAYFSSRAVQLVDGQGDFVTRQGRRADSSAPLP